MIKKIFILLIFAAAFQACDDRLNYSGNTRILMQGRIVDRDGSPLKDVPVKIFVQKERRDGNFLWGASDEDEDVISYTFTDDNGDYKMIMPRPNNQNNISLLINHNAANRPVHPNYSGKVITDIATTDATDNTINFTEQVLFRMQDTVKPTVTINNLPEYSYGSLLVNIDGLVHNNTVSHSNMYYQPSLQITEYLENYTSLRYSYNVAKNQTLSFKYKKGGLEGAIITHTIPIGNSDLDYTINY